MSQPQESQSSGLEARCAVEEQISFVLSHPGMSAWLKNALSSALDCHPIEVLNDLEILNLILHNRSHLLIVENSSQSIGLHDR
jgi:hypothetical protein